MRAVDAAEARIEVVNTGARDLEQPLLAGHVLGVGVGEVAEDRKVYAGIAIGDRDHLEVIDQRADAVLARQHRRNDDDGLRVVWNAVEQLEPAGGDAGRRCGRRLSAPPRCAISLNGTINNNAVMTSIAAGPSTIGHSAATTRAAVTA